MLLPPLDRPGRPDSSLHVAGRWRVAVSDRALVAATPQASSFLLLGGQNGSLQVGGCAAAVILALAPQARSLHGLPPSTLGRCSRSARRAAQGAWVAELSSEELLDSVRGAVDDFALRVLDLYLSLYDVVFGPDAPPEAACALQPATA